MATEKAIINPITRTGGRLRIKLEREGNQIKIAWSEIAQLRGIEATAENRDPHDAWAFVGRTCDVCTGTHSAASIAAVEDTTGSTPSLRARRIRDLVIGPQEIHGHVVHSCHFHGLDRIDVTKAPEVNPKKIVEFARSIGSTWKGNSEEAFARVKKTVGGITDSGQPFIPAGSYRRHEDYRLLPGADLMAVSHYLGALAFQCSIIQINTIFGGKNSHSNLPADGMTYFIDLERSETINQVSIDQIKSWIDEIVEFVSDCSYSDVVATMSVYKDYFGTGRSSDDSLAVGMAGATYSSDPAKLYVQTAHPNIKFGAILDGSHTKLHPPQPEKIEEFINPVQYAQEAGDDAGLKPYNGETTVNYIGPKPSYGWLSGSEKHTWSKAPWYDGHAVQVGPVTRVLLAYLQKEPETMRLADGVINKLDLCIEQMNPTAGRIYARAVESMTTASHLADHIFPEFVEASRSGDIDIFDNSRWEPTS